MVAGIFKPDFKFGTSKQESSEQRRAASRVRPVTNPQRLRFQMLTFATKKRSTGLLPQAFQVVCAMAVSGLPQPGRTGRPRPGPDRAVIWNSESHKVGNAVPGVVAPGCQLQLEGAAWAQRY